MKREGEEDRKTGGKCDSKRYDEGRGKWRVKWKLRTNVADPKELGENGK